MRKILRSLLLVLIGVSGLRAEVTGVAIEKRALFEGGRSFGTVGKYEVIDGVMRFAVDPKTPANLSIVDIGNAPRNARGQVEFEADFQLVRPVDGGRGNGALVFDVVNRGRFGSRSFATPEGAGTHTDFLLNRGFSVLAIGWQHDVPRQDGNTRLLGVKVPVATIKGKPITGLVAVNFTLAKAAPTQLLSDRGHVPYPVSNPNAPGTQLTINHLDGKKEIVPRAVGLSRDG